MKAVRTTRFTSLRPDEVDRIVAYAADGDLWCMDDANPETMVELMKHRSLLEKTTVQSRKFYSGYKTTLMPGGLVATNMDMALLHADMAENDKLYYLKKRGYWVHVMKKMISAPRYNKYLEVAFAGLLREAFLYSEAALTSWEAGDAVTAMPLWSSIMTPQWYGNVGRDDWPWPLLTMFCLIGPVRIERRVGCAERVICPTTLKYHPSS